jgi:DnaK suppressor protein
MIKEPSRLASDRKCLPVSVHGQDMHPLKSEAVKVSQHGDHVAVADRRPVKATIHLPSTRVEDGTYGYCEDTGEPTSIKRLEARPIATLSIEAQGAPRATPADVPQ